MIKKLQSKLTQKIIDYKNSVTPYELTQEIIHLIACIIILAGQTWTRFWNYLLGFVILYGISLLLRHFLVPLHFEARKKRWLDFASKLELQALGDVIFSYVILAMAILFLLTNIIFLFNSRSSFLSFLIYIAGLEFFCYFSVMPYFNKFILAKIIEKRKNLRKV